MNKILEIRKYVLYNYLTNKLYKQGMTQILRTTISNYLVNDDFKNIIEDIIDSVRINYYNYSRFVKLLLNKLIQKIRFQNMKSDFFEQRIN